MDPDAIKAYLIHHGYGAEGEDIETMAQRWAADRPTAALRSAGIMRHGGMDHHKLLPAIAQEMQALQQPAAPAQSESDDDGGVLKGVAAVADDIIPAIVKGVK